MSLGSRKTVTGADILHPVRPYGAGPVRLPGVAPEYDGKL